MKIAVLSGKGGAGKTFVAVNLAAVAGQATYVDCDVEEPNGHLFLKPERVTDQSVFTKLPAFDPKKCTGCRACVAFCRFNALVYVKEKPIVFPEVCHFCGGCSLVCKEGAITETLHRVGEVKTGIHKELSVVTGILDYGEVSGVPVIKEAIQIGEKQGGTVILDCPPGSACPVVESVVDADFCVLVVEPTAFGFHNFLMVYELVQLLKKPCAVVINKMEAAYEPLEDYVKEQHIPVFLRIPYEPKLAKILAEGKVAVEEQASFRAMFEQLLEQIEGALS